MAKFLQINGRAAVAHVFDPIARFLLRARVTPNMVTVAGTVGVIAGALVFAFTGRFITATVIITLSAFTDLIDGTMARQRIAAGIPNGKFGALLDSTCDRIADAATFGAGAYWLASHHRPDAAAAALVTLVTGVAVSYAKARAEGLGFTANVGLVERAERLILLGVGAIIEGLGVKYAIDVALWILAAGSAFTIYQRMHTVYLQDQAALAAAESSP